MKLEGRRRDIAFTAIAFSIAMLTFAGLSTFANQSNGLHEQAPLTGHIVVSVDGKAVYSGDTIMTIDWDYFFCKVFNDTTACNFIGGVYAGGAAPLCQFKSFNNGVTVHNNFYSGSDCSEVAMALSTDATNQGNTNWVLPAELTGNGLDPAKAVTTHVANTNTIMLTASWTFTGTSQGNIQKVGLFPWNDGSNAFTNPGTLNSVAIDTFTAQTLTTGQSLSIQWTFSL